MASENNNANSYTSKNADSSLCYYANNNKSNGNSSNLREPLDAPVHTGSVVSKGDNLYSRAYNGEEIYTA